METSDILTWWENVTDENGETSAYPAVSVYHPLQSFQDITVQSMALGLPNNPNQFVVRVVASTAALDAVEADVNFTILPATRSML